MKNNLAPVGLFVYNRFSHTKKTIEALQNNHLADLTELYIYSDAAKNQDAEAEVSKTREYIRNITGFKKVSIIEQEKNKGLASSVIDGVTEIVNRYGKIIVLEDDLITAPNFLSYMNDALYKYQDKTKVFSISGYSYCPKIKDNTYFLKLITSWGWATWSDRWSKFKMAPKELSEFLKDKNNKFQFDYNNSYNFSSFIKRDTTWALYWYYACFKSDGLSLFPSKSLVQNVGFDGSGVHSTGQNDEALEVFNYQLTDNIMELKQNKTEVIKSFKSNTRIGRLKAKIPPQLKAILAKYYVKTKTMILNPRKIKGSFIDKSVQVLGWGNVKIGKGSVISEGGWFNINNRNDDNKSLIIGDYCYIGKRNFFSTGLEILFKDYSMTGIDCHFLGASHLSNSPFTPYISSPVKCKDSIVIGYNVCFATSVTVIGNVSIGQGSIIGARSVVTKDIPPFSLAVGTPAKVIKRFNFQLMKWINIEDYTSELDKLMPSEDQYIEQLNKTAVNIPLIASSKSFGDLL